MSLSHKADVFMPKEDASDAKHHGYGFVLALLCIALALVVASRILTPVSIGSGISSDSQLVGP